MAPTLLSWPPGTPPSRFNLLRRDRYCGGVARCVHEDIRCCCNLPPPGCGCPNWPEEDPPCNPAELLPDLEIETIPTTGCANLTSKNAMIRCGDPSSIYEGYWVAGVELCGSIFGYVYLYCERNIDFFNPSCMDYKLDFYLTVSGCETAPDAPQYPTRCVCGSYPDTEAEWWWEEIYTVEAPTGFPCEQSNPPGPPGCDCPDPLPEGIKFDIWIHGLPPAPTTFSALRTTSTSHRGIPVAEPELPEDVSNWLNGNN